MVTDMNARSPVVSIAPRTLWIAGAIAVAVLLLYVTLSNPGPWVGTWTVDHARLADRVNQQLTASGLPAIVPSGSPPRLYSRSLGIHQVVFTLQTDGSWHGSLPGLLQSTAASGSWTSTDDTVHLNVERPPGPAIEGRRRQRNLEFVLRTPVGLLAIPFTR